MEDVVELSLIPGRCFFSWISFLFWGIPLGFWCLPLSAWEWNCSAAVTLDPHYQSFLIWEIYSSLLLINCCFFSMKNIAIMVKKSWTISSSLLTCYLGKQVLNKVGQPDGWKAVSLSQICVICEPSWGEDAQMRQLDMSHGNVQIMTGTAWQLTKACHGRPPPHIPLWA